MLHGCFNLVTLSPISLLIFERELQSCIIVFVQFLCLITFDANKENIITILIVTTVNLEYYPLTSIRCLG